MRVPRPLCLIHTNEFPSQMMGKMYILNAPMVFTMVWKVVKPWLTERILGKIEIFSDTGHERLKLLIDPKNLPADLGGECRCCERGCCFSTATAQEIDHTRLCKVGLHEYDKSKQSN